MKLLEYFREGGLSSETCILCRAAVRDPVMEKDGMCICKTCFEEMERYQPGSVFLGTKCVPTVYAVAPYRGILRSAFLQHKFFNQKGYAKIFSMLAQEAFLPNEFAKRYDMLLPVPLSVQRMRERGYNQAALLAEKLAEEFRIPYREDALFRVRETQKQSRLSVAERRSNVENAFLADARKVGGKRILLVDDIFTFGATLDACAQALREGGAVKIDAAVFFKAVLREEKEKRFH